MHRKLNVKGEDEVIDALICWFKHNIHLVNDKELVAIMN
jgi:hypothetical protein